VHGGRRPEGRRRGQAIGKLTEQPIRFLAYQIADRLQVLDVEQVLALPMVQIMEWVEFIRHEAREAEIRSMGSGKPHINDPRALLEAMQKGGR
jgi:hypothetical protein